ncbi:AEC family transporter [Clostridium sp. JN-9]|uniref:AEC family transporter n=1 Tax=Clostridium sp. JN-9 TaxID=2507159 RepID=UPI000FFE12DE|nr:AEC family transporter [Clostridium sp. JN-9]QAT40357.1 AEC family transporter [Clostridium sp. JN-9]
MQIIFTSLQSILSIIIMILIGYFLTKKKWFDNNASKLFSKIVFNISLPALMIENLCTNFNRQKFSSLSKGLMVPFLSMGISYIIGITLSKIIKVKKGRRGTFVSMFFVSNTIFIGLPVNLALFGDKSVPYVLLYYVVNTSFFWTLGTYGISNDGHGGNNKILSSKTLKQIFTPPLIGFLVGLSIIFANINLPKFILDTCKYLGNLTTPLSMMFIGITIYSVNLKEVKFSLDMFAILIGRFLVSPMLVIILTWFFPIPDLMKQVFVMQAAMPVMTNTSIVAAKCGGDYEYAAIMTVITTIACVFIIPFYMLLLNL